MLGILVLTLVLVVLEVVVVDIVGVVISLSTVCNTLSRRASCSFFTLPTPRASGTRTTALAPTFTGEPERNRRTARRTSDFGDQDASTMLIAFRIGKTEATSSGETGLEGETVKLIGGGGGVEC